MAKSPAFQFYPVDFVHGVSDLTTEAVGAYILLLCRQWDKGAIPDDQEACARIARCQASAVASIWHKFGICDESGRKNARLEAVRAEQSTYREKQAANGAKRWKKSAGNASAVPSLSGGNASAVPSLSGGNASAVPSLSGGNAVGMPNACPLTSPSPSILPLSSPEGDNEPVSSETEAAEKKEGGRADARIASEAGVRIRAMFPGAGDLNPASFGQLLEHVATGTLPADEKKWRALATMRAERAAIEGIPDDYDLRAAWLISKERLCRDLPEALETAIAKRPQRTAIAPEPKKEPAPADWQKKLVALYPNAHVPTDFYELPPEVRDEVKGAA